MEDDRARALLGAEKSRVQALLSGSLTAGQQDRAAANEQEISPIPPSPHRRTRGQCRGRGIAGTPGGIDRAERRLEEGSFGRSVRSGVAIPDERLEADPAAELTVEEAAET